MLASKSEKDSLGGTLFFNLAHYVLRPWPWIITALCSIIIFPELKDIQAAFPGADPAADRPRQRFSGDAEISARRVRRADGRRPDRGELFDHPDASQLGLVLPGARLLSPFHRHRRSEKHYVTRRPCLHRRCSMCSRRCSARAGLGAGGLRGPDFDWRRHRTALFLRWFWWRINAWCEVVAMVSSFTISVVFFLMKKSGHPLPFAHTVLYSVAFTTVAWLITAFVEPARRAVRRLIAFYQKVHPSGPGWTRIRRAAGVSEAEAARLQR